MPHNPFEELENPFEPAHKKKQKYSPIRQKGFQKNFQEDSDGIIVLKNFIATGLWTICPCCNSRIEFEYGEPRGIVFECDSCHEFFKVGQNLHIEFP